MARTTSEADTARALGCNVKTLSRYRDRKPPVPHVMRNGRPFYDPAEVRAYQIEHGIGQRPGDPPPVATVQPVTPTGPAPLPPIASAPPPDGGAQASEAGARAQGAKAGAAVQLQRAKELQHKAKVREGATKLEVWDQLRKVVTEDDLIAVSKELAALHGEGLILDGQMRVAREQLTEIRQALKLRKKTDTGGALERALVVTTETIPLVTAFEGITDAGRRARALAFVLAIADEDRALGPRPDTGEAQEAVA